MAVLISSSFGNAPNNVWGNRVTDSIVLNAHGERAGYTASYVDNATQVTTAMLSQSYAVRDDLGRITRLETTIRKTDGTGSESLPTLDYVYENGRLKSVWQGLVQVDSFEYDDNGNRLVTGATYDAQDRLLTYGALSFQYTDNGELKKKTRLVSGQPQDTLYTYDVFGNLRSVTLPDNTPIEYVVDSAGRRIGKKVSGALKKKWLYRSGLQIAAEIDDNGVKSQFGYSGGRNVPDFMIRNSVPYRIITDHLGSVRLVVNANTGAVVQRMDYSVFGYVTNDWVAAGQTWRVPFGFAGGLYDPDTKLVRFGARDYDAEVGRWTAKDPIRFGGGDANLYGYVIGDPVNALDANGLYPLSGFPIENGIAPSPVGTGIMVSGGVGSFAVGGEGYAGLLNTTEGLTPFWGGGADVPAAATPSWGGVSVQGLFLWNPNQFLGTGYEIGGSLAFWTGGILFSGGEPIGIWLGLGLGKGAELHRGVTCTKAF